MPCSTARCSSARTPRRRQAGPLAAALERGEISVGLECEIAGRGGKPIPHVMSAAPIHNPEGRQGGAVLVLQDITRIKELERLREEWTAVVAHDLRQPVSLVSLSAQQLLRQQGAADSQTQLKLGLRVRTAADALARMVNDLLDASRIQSRRLVVDPREVDLGRGGGAGLATAGGSDALPAGPARAAPGGAPRADGRPAAGADPRQPALQRGQVRRARRDGAGRRSPGARATRC